MAGAPRIVAELGRPETAQETADRKAASSFAYRSSKTTRNLIAAMLVTVAVVVVIIFAVPRGEPAPRPPIDVAASADKVSSALDRTVLVPEVPAEWTVNGAAVTGDQPQVWTTVYVPEDDPGFVRVAQGFDADETWPTRVLAGADVDGAVTIDGIEWTTYEITDPASAGNVSRAMSAPAGADTVLVYGTSDEAIMEQAAASITDQITALREENE